ncbi:MAG: T9SS type A sorting domain-containing protein [Sinomicrobium sp.]|nr:T9SS type A sorting domain-containing protein [Sinomicrobium sp.]
MKNFYFLILTVLISTSSFGQEVVITGYIDSTCPGQNGRTIEIYVNGTIDFTGWNMVRQANGGGFNSNIDMSGLGTVSDDFAYLTNDIPTLTNEFGITANVIQNAATITANGDDGFQIVDPVGTVIDRFSYDGVDGTGTTWEYTDSYYIRNDGATPNGGAFDPANWTFAPVGSLIGLGRCNNGDDPAFAFSNYVPFGAYQHNPLSVEQPDLEGFNIYPNPVTNGTVIISTAKNLVRDVLIFDVLGKQVLNARLEKNSLDVSPLVAGVYFIKVTEGKKTAVRKLVIK